METQRDRDISLVNASYDKVRDLRRFLAIGEEYDLIRPAMAYEDDGLYERVNAQIGVACQQIVDTLEDLGLFPIITDWKDATND